jgi:hypothetical protein
MNSIGLSLKISGKKKDKKNKHGDVLKIGEVA